MFRERDIGERIHWTPVGGTENEWFGKISDITPGSRVGLETDEGDSVKIKVTRNEMWDFAGSIYDTQPDPPQSKHLADLEDDAEVEFTEPNLIYVFSVPKQPSE